MAWPPRPDINELNPERKAQSMSNNLQQLISETQGKFKANAEAAKATFESRSALQDGLRSEVSIRQHRLTVDEPASLGGTDSGPNPVELILASLGSCQEITYRAYATALGIPLDNVSVTVEGDIDLRGFFAVDESVRAGYQAIRATVHLESSASEAQLEQLRDVVNAHCPVLDIVARPVPVELSLKITQPPVAAAA
jgi:uncharacterized OsmC-like protein